MVHGVRLERGWWVCNLHAQAHSEARAQADVALAAATASEWAAGRARRARRRPQHAPPGRARLRARSPATASTTSSCAACAPAAAAYARPWPALGPRAGAGTRGLGRIGARRRRDEHETNAARPVRRRGPGGRRMRRRRRRRRLQLHARRRRHRRRAAAASRSRWQNIAFDPKDVTVKVGQKITWTNDDTTDHNVTADSGADFKSKDFGKDGDLRFHPRQGGHDQVRVHDPSGDDGDDHRPVGISPARAARSRAA